MNSASARRRADLEDASLPLEQQHQELMEQIQKLYNRSKTVYWTSHKLQVPDPGTAFLITY